MTDEVPNSALLEDFLSKMPDNQSTLQISAILLTIADRYMSDDPAAVAEMLVKNAIVYAYARGIGEVLPPIMRLALQSVTEDSTQTKVH